jgi:hypothetical protein
MEWLEVYVLCESRSATAAHAFLKTFLPDRTPATDAYPIPELVDLPVEVIRSPDDLIMRLEIESCESYSLYWNSTSNRGPRQAMLFYSEDGAMVAGLVVRSSEVDEFLLKLAQTVNGRFGYISGDQPPPATSAGFIELCLESTLPCIVDGKLRNSSTAID